MPIHSEDARAFSEHIEQMTAAPGETRDVEIPRQPVWYDLDGGMIDLTKLVGVERYCPANQKYMPTRPDGAQTVFIMGRLPAPDRYGKSEVYLFSGSWLEVEAELNRIKALLRG